MTDEAEVNEDKTGRWEMTTTTTMMLSSQRNVFSAEIYFAVGALLPLPIVLAPQRQSGS